MNFKKYIAIPFCMVFFASASAQKTMTLQECIEAGIANNFDVEQRRVAEQVEGIYYKQSKLNLLPDLNGQAGHSFNQGRSIDPFTNSPVTQSFNSSNYSLSSGVILFSGFSKVNLIKQAGLSWQAAQMELQQEKDNLSINIILAYLQVLSLAEQLNLVREQASLSAKQVERLGILNEHGAIKPSELSDLKGQYANDVLAITNTVNDMLSARLSLFRLMNIKNDSTIVFEKINADEFASLTEINSEQVYHTALAQLAIIKASNLRTQSAMKGLKVARGGVWPTLRLGGSAYTQYSSVAMLNNITGTSFQQSESYVTVNGQQYPVFIKQDHLLSSKIAYGDQLNNNLNTNLGFTLSLPLFNALQQRNKIKLAQLEVKRNEIVAANTKRQLQQDVDQAALNMQTAIDRYNVLLQQVNAYHESFEAAEARFTEGVGNSIDYLIAKNNVDRANRNLISARYDYVLRNKILDFYQGKKFWK